MNETKSSSHTADDQVVSFDVNQQTGKLRVRHRQEAWINDFLAAFSIPASLFPDNLWTMRTFSILPHKKSAVFLNIKVNKPWIKLHSFHCFIASIFFREYLEIPFFPSAFPIMEESCQLRTIISLSAPKQEPSLSKTRDELLFWNCNQCFGALYWFYRPTSNSFLFHKIILDGLSLCTVSFTVDAFSKLIVCFNHSLLPSFHTTFSFPCCLFFSIFQSVSAVVWCLKVFW